MHPWPTAEDRTRNAAAAIVREVPEAPNLADSVRTRRIDWAWGRCRRGDSHVEAELHDVAVGHDVVLALHPHPARCLGGVHRPGLDQVVVGDDLGLDEAAPEVGVDDAG